MIAAIGGHEIIAQAPIVFSGPTATGSRAAHKPPGISSTSAWCSTKWVALRRLSGGCDHRRLVHRRLQRRVRKPDRGRFHNIPTQFLVAIEAHGTTSTAAVPKPVRWTIC